VTESSSSKVEVLANIVSPAQWLKNNCDVCIYQLYVENDAASLLCHTVF